MSSLSETATIVYVTGHYHWLAEPLVYLYRKYFDVPITFFSDRPMPGHDAVEVFPRDFPLYEKPCGKMVKDALRQIENPLVTISLMDLLPIHPVDLVYFHMLETFMVDNPRVARGNLWAEMQWKVQHMPDVLYKEDEFSIIHVPATDPHIGQIGSTSLMPALWNRQFLLDFIEDDWSLDMLEVPGQRKFLAQQHWYSVATFPGLLDPCHLCYTSDKSVVRISTIPDEQDREFVRAHVPQGFNVE